MKTCVKIVATLVLCLAAAGCAPMMGKMISASREPQNPDGTPLLSCELTVNLRAKGKVGLRDLSIEDYEEGHKAGPGSEFKHVKYSELGDIIVVVEGPNQSDRWGTESDIPEPNLEFTDKGFDHEQLVSACSWRTGANDAASKAATKDMNKDTGEKMSKFSSAVAHSMPMDDAVVRITNKRAAAANFCALDDKGHCVQGKVEPGAQQRFYFEKPGIYDLTCDEDEDVHCTLIITDSVYIRSGRSGESAKIKLPPGDFTIKVYAPRLPVWSDHFSVKDGDKAELTPVLGVNDMTKAK